MQRSGARHSDRGPPPWSADVILLAQRTANCELEAYRQAT